MSGKPGSNLYLSIMFTDVVIISNFLTVKCLSSHESRKIQILGSFPPMQVLVRKRP